MPKKNGVPSVSLNASRPMGVAAQLVGASLNEEQIFSKKVVLTGESEALDHLNGRYCFLASLRLLARTVGELEVLLPAGVGDDLQHEVNKLVHSAWSQRRVRRIQFIDEDCSPCAILNVGWGVKPELPWTSIMSDGWVARCTSGDSTLPRDAGFPNPMGALLAASFGVSDVFKRVYGIPADIAPLYDSIAFSLFEMSEQFRDGGPTLPAQIALPDTLLLGAGAIGNGIALLLSQLSLDGNLLIIDKQDFGAENHATCCLFDDDAWIGKPKAEMLAAWMSGSGRLDVKGKRATIQQAVESDVLSGLKVDLVLNGLDDVEARREVQRLWPSLLVDGGINSVGAAVVTHSLSQPSYACLRCTFELATSDEKEVQAGVTGLNKSALTGDLNRQLNDEDIRQATDTRRDWLREQMRAGRTVCSVISEAMKAGLGLRLNAGFQPSVPFVATASAALVVAQMLRSLHWPDMPFVHECQIGSLFIGPSTSQRLRRISKSTCECNLFRKQIEALAQSRRRGL